MGFVLVALFSFAVVSLARSLWSNGPFWGARLEKAPEPEVNALEARSRADIQAARSAVNGILAQSGAPAERRAAAYGQLGRMYLAYGLWNPAAACLRNAASLDSKSSQWPYLLAKALALAGQHEAASAAMNSALYRMAKDPGASLQDRLPAYCFLAESALQQNRTDDARGHLEAAQRANPRAPFPLFRLGQLAAHAGEHGRAAGFYERGLASIPGRADLREWATAQPQSGAPVTPLPPPPFPYADPVYAALAELDRSSATLLRLGIEHLARGRRRRALDTFRQAVEANPELVTARAYYAEELLVAGKLDEARRESDEVLRRDPVNRRARATLARAFAASPATRDKGISLALALRQEEAARPEPLLMLGAVYTAAGRFNEALAAYRQAAADMPKIPAPRLGEGAMLAALGRYAPARAVYEKAAQSFPANPNVRLTLARFLVTAPDRAARDPRRGLELAQQLLATGFSVSRAETAAIAQAANGRFPAAIALIQKALGRGEDETEPAGRLRLQRVLLSFQSKKPWTEPWPFHGATDPE
jgi:tetratricopeptide (TPR) repeat protein